MNESTAVALRRIGILAPTSVGGFVCPVRVPGVISHDRLLVELTGEAIEIELVLCGLEPMQPTTDRAIDALEWVEEAVRRVRSRGFVYLPRPTHVGRFVKSLAEGGIFAGLLFLHGDDWPLNARIAQAKICDIDPQCEYLQCYLKRPPAAA